MAFITAEVKIPGYHRTITTELYFPTDLPESVGNKINGVITLLHGRSNTAGDWMRMTCAPRYAADNGYVLIAPTADNSFYMDMAYGDAFYTILSEALPAQLRAIFQLPGEREKNFIAGLSMGGYGALRFALAHPGRYAACASFSGSIAVREMLTSPAAAQSELRDYAISLVGPEMKLPDEVDLFWLARQVAALPRAQQPRILCTCGNQDGEFVGIAAQNEAFAAHAKALGLDYTYLKWDGEHDFAFWDRSLAQFFSFIQGSDYLARKQADWNAPAANGAP